jgi:hypothetical protein
MSRIYSVEGFLNSGGEIWSNKNAAYFSGANEANNLRSLVVFVFIPEKMPYLLRSNPFGCFAAGAKGGHR